MLTACLVKGFFNGSEKNKNMVIVLQQEPLPIQLMGSWLRPICQRKHSHDNFGIPSLYALRKYYFFSVTYVSTFGLTEKILRKVKRLQAMVLTGPAHA